MRSQATLAGILVSFTLFFGPAHAEDDRPVVRWVVQDFPPVWILEGPKAGLGIGGRTLDYFTARMPEFRHERIAASFQRVMALLRESDGYCYSTALKTPEREREILFSTRIHQVFNNRVIVRGRDEQRFSNFVDEHGALRLEALLGEPSLRGAYSEARAYSPKMDEALANPPEGASLVKLARSANLTRLLMKGRVDYIFGYPWEARYVAQEDGQDPDALMSFPVAGDSAYLSGHMACYDGPIGRSVIAAVNHIAAESGPHPPYQDYYLEWIDPHARAAFRWKE